MKTRKAYFKYIAALMLFGLNGIVATLYLIKQL